MPDALRTALERQFAIAKRLLDLHLTGLTDAESLWRPTPRGPHVQRGDDDRWVAGLPEREDYAAGAPSIAWLTWHVVFWWSTVLDRSFGSGRREPAAIAWPGSAEAVALRIGELAEDWRERIAALSDRDLASTELACWPFEDRPFADVVAWVNLELTKNAAEIGLVRFLYAARPGRD